MREETIFREALARSTPMERVAYLNQACAGQPELRRAVEAWLAAHDVSITGCEETATGTNCRGDDYPPAPAFRQHTRAMTEGHAPLEPGVLIAGRYVLMEEIGEGGMGEVWVANQTKPFQREVALKVIKVGMDSRAVLARFDQERQALAMMDHPHIAKVLDGGLTPAGRPFFVMELVRGLPLTKFCDDARLAPRQRLELFLPICRAVQHAHQKGIVHRDLKPSNVLVTVCDGRPVPMVIDFGVAKAIGGKLGESRATQLGAVIGTLEYMAPEQTGLSAMDVDTRADVYSLGVILYELLTGRLPFDSRRLQEATLIETLRIIREEEPPLPSTRVSTDECLPSLAAARRMEPKKLSTLLRGELDWIVMKCLEKDRTRRYETANELERDVQRYLTQEPVLAGPPGAGYRVRKFVVRNKVAVLATGTIAIALVAGIIVATWGLIRARGAEQAEAQRAEGERKANAESQRRFAQLLKANNLLASVFADVDPRAEEKEGKPLRALLGDRLNLAAEQLEGETVGDPEIVAALQDRLGQSMVSLGMAERALPLLAKALATRTALLGSDHPDTLTTLNNLAAAYKDSGKLDQALPRYEETFRLRSAKLGAKHPSTLSSMNNLALGYHAVGDFDRAMPLFEESFKLHKAALGPTHPSTLTSMHNLAAAYLAARKLDQAIPLFEEALRMQVDKLGADHADTLHVMDGLATAYGQAGQLARAITALEETLRLRKAKLGEDHPRTLDSMNNLAMGYRTDRKFDKAIPLFERTLTLRRARLGLDHPDALHSMRNLAMAYHAARRLKDALPLYEETLKLRQTKLGAAHPDTILSMSNLASGLQADGKLDQAQSLYEETIELGKPVLGADHDELLTCMNNLAMCHQSSGQMDRALPLYEEAFKLIKGKPGAGHPQRLAFSYNLGACYLAAGKPDVALPILQEAATELEQRKFAHDSAPVLVARLVECQETLKLFEQAETWRCKWLAVVKELSGAESATYAELLAGLGGNLLLQKRFEDAEPLLLQGYEAMKQHAAKSSARAKEPQLRQALEWLVQLYQSWGKTDEAARWASQLAALQGSGQP